MRGVAVVVTLALWVCGCTRQAEPVAVEEEPLTIAVTQWSERTEIFMEYPPLVAGETARFAVHLTDLATFQPVRIGRVVVTLNGTPRQEFVTEGPSVPGIFGVDVVPSRSGVYAISVALQSTDLSDVHQLGEAIVHSDASTAGKTVLDEEEGTIAFLKEQQWVLDFSTELVQERSVRESLRVPAEIRPRTGGEVEVTAPISGRLATSTRLRVVGSAVALGETLAELTPRSGSAGDRASLELNLVEARSMLTLARAERERAERLVDAGAVPARRRSEARIGEETAEARVRTAEQRLTHLDLTQTGQGEGSRETRFALRAPLSGVIAETQVTPGASVEEGQPLFRIVAVDTVHVVGNVPEAEGARLLDLTGAELEAVGLDVPLPLGRLISIGRVIDRATRTLPVIYELQRLDPRLAVGQTVFLRVFTSSRAGGVTVPDTTIVDDGGQLVVFVQVGGESFERRAVLLGSREGGLVQVLDGVSAGERVVTRGAPLIRLAALSPQVPAHGHIH